MKRIYRLLSWILSMTVMVCVLLFGWRTLQNQSREESRNPYKYDISRYSHVDPALVHYSESKTIGITAETLHAIATDKDGNIFASADLKLLKFNNAGELIKSTTLSEPCYCITAGDNGELYLGMQDHITVCDESLSVTASWGKLGENARLTSIALFGEFLYAADSGQRRIWKLSTDGKMLGQAGSSEPNHYIVPSPYFDLVADGESLWIANPGHTRIEQIDSDDNLITQWGNPSMSIEGFPGCCNPSHIAGTTDGFIVTAEKGIPRVKVYDKAGNLVSVVARPKDFNNTTPGCFTEATIKDIAVDRQGRILVLDRSTGAIRIFTRKNN